MADNRGVGIRIKLTDLMISRLDYYSDYLGLERKELIEMILYQGIIDLDLNRLKKGE